MVKRDSSLQRTLFHCSNGGELYTTPADAWHWCMVILGLYAAAQPWSRCCRALQSILPTICLRRLHGRVLNFIHRSATGVAKTVESTHLKVCPHTFVYIEHLGSVTCRFNDLLILCSHGILVGQRESEEHVIERKRELHPEISLPRKYII